MYYGCHYSTRGSEAQQDFVVMTERNPCDYKNLSYAILCSKCNELQQLSLIKDVVLDCEAENQIKSSAYCHPSSTLKLKPPLGSRKTYARP
jgi:hypothetical protein